MNIVEATALQLAWERCRDEPNEQDRKDAAVMVKRWDEQREQMGLKPWE